MNTTNPAALAAPATAPAQVPAPVPASAPATEPARLLALAFGFFNGLRTLAYLPTILTIVTTGHSDQHSLFTWFVWLGANSTMAAWAYTHGSGRRVDRVVLVSLGNATMCLVTALVIVWFRL